MTGADLLDLVKVLLGCTNGASTDPLKPGPSRFLVEPEPEEMPEKPTVADFLAMEVLEGAPSDFPFLEKAIKTTGQFEGRGYGQVTGDFDRQGLSVGILQWCIGQGSLQRVILQSYRKRYGSIKALGIFPDGQLVDALAEVSTVRGLELVRKNMLSGTKVKPNWASAWIEFLTTPQVMNLQKEGCLGVAAKAQILCKAWQAENVRGFCFFFDIVTQNGSMKSVKKYYPSKREALELVGKAAPDNRKLWAPLIDRATPQQLMLLQAAYDRARLSNPTYFQDVYSRKGTIALGRGFVHGHAWDLFPAGT